MSQTLIVHSDKSVIDLLNLNLPIYVGTDVIVKESFKEAQILIEHHPGIHLIVCADHCGEEQTAEAIYNFNLSHQKKTPLIVIGKKGKVPPAPHVTILPHQPDLKLILHAAALYLKVTPKKMIEQAVPDFFPISIHFFRKINKTPCSLYLVSGEEVYQERFKEDETVKAEEIQKLMQEGHIAIYVAAANRLKVVNHITTDLIGRFSKGTMTAEEKFTAADEALQVIQEEALKGETPASRSTQELTSTAIRTCLEIAKNSPTIAGLLKKLFSSRTSYIYRHTQLIIYISQHIISNVEWGSNEQKDKLAFVAFFHDICLTEDKLAKFSTDYAVNNDEDITKGDKEIIFKHAKMSAELIQKFPIAPLGSDMIIMQHHGTISGQGFAKTFTNSLSPLAIVFIIAEEMSHMILDLHNPDELSAMKEDMLMKLSNKYSRSKYQKIIESLNSLSF